MAADPDPPPELVVRLRVYRARSGWSQQDLADRAGVSRAGVSAIETGRVAPSTSAALALAAALGVRVEDLFALPGEPEEGTPTWAWDPPSEDSRFWEAQVHGRRLLYPVEPGPAGLPPHDGTFPRGARARHGKSGHDPRRTLVLAGCDPAAGLLVAEAARQEDLRVVVLLRSSGAALELLRTGLVHVAGVHLGAGSAGGNASAVRGLLGPGYKLLRVTRWEEGVALDPGRRLRSVASAARARLRWIGREAGAGARQCFEEILPGRPSPDRLARSHRGVAEAIRSGLADAGICLRLTSAEAGLGFIPVRSEAYDLCYRSEDEADDRLRALRRVVRSSEYRGLLRDLPGYESRGTGEIERAH